MFVSLKCKWININANAPDVNHYPEFKMILNQTWIWNWAILYENLGKSPWKKLVAKLIFTVVC